FGQHRRIVIAIVIAIVVLEFLGRPDDPVYTSSPSRSSRSLRFAGDRSDAQADTDADRHAEDPLEVEVSHVNTAGSKRGSFRWESLFDSSKGIGSWPVAGSAVGSRGLLMRAGSHETVEGRWHPRSHSVAASSFSATSFADFNRRKAPSQFCSGSTGLSSAGLGGRRGLTLFESLLGSSSSSFARLARS
ncbi:unnamed protein product, partial [Prorocentrum cordatum]